MPLTTSSRLAALAKAAGILPGFIDQAGKPQRTRSTSIRAVLAALGYPAQGAADVEHSLQLLRETRLLKPTFVVQSPAVRLPTHARRRGGQQTYHAECCLEDGTVLTQEGKLPRQGALTLALRAKLPLGYHQVTLAVGDTQALSHVIVVPKRCRTPADIWGKHPHQFGLWANLYTMHSQHSWGVGDLTDLASLMQFAADCGAAFVGVNPLHALRNQGTDISPYAPVSRIFRNPIYLDIEAVPELADSSEARALLARRDVQDKLTAARGASHIDYPAVNALKNAALRALHRTFMASRDSSRRRAYDEFVVAVGPALQSFALFCALDAHFSSQGHTGGWPSWPHAYRQRHTPDVTAFAKSHADDIAFHMYVQFELDRQLAHVAERACQAKMALGLYQDLAIGTAPGGAEPWVFPELFVPALSAGAPPDYYSTVGQDWGLPPLHPHAQSRDGYRYWRTLLQSAFAHSGALRIDHIMGLFRLFVIPRGQAPKHGAYVRYPAEDFLGILALESQRHQALVIGEDLGTVPRGLPAVLRRYGVLSSRVFYFEQTRRGAFRPAHRYSDHALVTATTHDHAPIAGFCAARDIALRHHVGHIAHTRALARAQSARQRELTAMKTRLRRSGCLASKSPTPSDIITAIHRFLRTTPAPLVGISLDDLAGETEPVNMPGVSPDRYPCWSRRMQQSLERLMTDPDVVTRLGKA